MRMGNQKYRRSFYVIQFIELPFESIDDYVCVPYSWLITPGASNGRVAVTYPSTEDLFDTKERVKRKEKPNDDWRLYLAVIKYESDNYRDAEFWIATRNNFHPGEEQSKIGDTQPESVLDKKRRSASQSLGSDPNSNKPRLTVKPQKNPRQPLPRTSIKRPPSQSPDKNLDNKRLKLNEKPEIVTDHAIIESECSKQEQSKLNTGNQLIQNDQTNTHCTSNAEMNTEQSTKPEIIKENQPVHMSVQSSLKKILTEQQPSPKLSVEQQPSSNIPAKQQHSPIDVDYQQPCNMSVADLNKSDEVIESCQNTLAESAAKERTSIKTPLNTVEQTPHPEPIKKRSFVVCHERSLSESYPQDLSVRQSKKPNDSQKTHLNWNFTAPKIIPRPSNITNPPLQQFPILPVNSTLYSKLKPREIDERNSMIHNHQIRPSQVFMPTTPSTSHEPNWEKFQLSTSSFKKQTPVEKSLRLLVDKKTRLENITKNITRLENVARNTTMQYPTHSTMQHSLPTGSAVMQTLPLAQNYLQQAQLNSSQVNNVRCSMGEKVTDQRVPHSKGIMKTSAAQNLSKLAHHHSFVGPSHEQQYILSTQEDYLQQFSRIQDMRRKPPMAQTRDPRIYSQNYMMNIGFFEQSQPNTTNQSIQFFPKNENQNIPVNSPYAREVIRYEQVGRSIDGVHTTYQPIVQNGLNIQLAALNSSNQLHQNSEHPQQKQYPPNYHGLCTANTQNNLPLQSKHSSYILRPQTVTKILRSPYTLHTPSQARSNAQECCFLPELSVERRVNQSYTENSYKNPAVFPENITVKPVPTTQDIDVQTMPSSDQPYEIQSTWAGSNQTVVDQATQTDSIMDVDHCVEKIARSPVGEITPKIVDSACQTDEWLGAEQGSLYEETVSDSESATEHEVESENEIVSEAYLPTPTTTQNLTLENQRILSRRDVEQEMLDTLGTLITQLGANLSFTRNMFGTLRNSTLLNTQIYESLLEKVEEFNSIETLQIPTFPPNNETSEVTQESPAVDDDNNTDVRDAPSPILDQRGTFTLPAEYDPKDSKWTLKYREFKPGLIELIPRTGIYVSKKKLQRCKKISTDFRRLARMLLTEVFSMNALSVCSWTGEKAKALNSVKIDVRPGLDEHARMVLLTYVEEHLNKRGWILCDPSSIISSLRTKIKEIRAKHDAKVELSNNNS